jgi:hypothetical protein
MFDGSVKLPQALVDQAAIEAGVDELRREAGGSRVSIQGALKFISLNRQTPRLKFA